MPNNPSLRPTIDLGKFRFWCQKVLPLVYDDSISYYEVLGKMVVYLNQVIDDVNIDNENIETLHQAFIELQQYVADAIQYDISDLEQAVATAVHSAEMASESATIASGAAETATSAEANVLEYAQQASGSASNAAQSAISALEAQQATSGYASDANQSALNAANSALNAITMADQASGYCQRAETAATSAEGYAQSAEDDADSAEHFKDEANDSALKSEGHAVGKQNGVDVGNDSPYYHNNAKYYAEQAGQASGLSVSLDTLTNVDIQNPTDGQALVYDADNQVWVNSDDATGVTSLDALTDTDISSPSAGQVLMYDSANSKWVNSEEKEVAIAPSAPSDPATKLWIDSAQQTPIEIPTTAELNQALSEVGGDITNIEGDITNLQTAVESKADLIGVNTALATKQDKVTIIEQVAPSAITLADNTEYYLTNVSDLTFTYPVSGRYECWIYIETATSGTSPLPITFPTSEYIGNVPEFAANEKWEISIKNGVIIAGKIE